MAKDPDNRSSTRRRYALTATPFLIGIVALYSWVISPHVGYLHAMRRLEPVVDRMAGELNAVCGSLDKKLPRMRAMREELENVRQGLFTGEESRVFIHDLQALVGRAGCAMMATDFACEDAGKATDPNIPFVVEASHVDLTVQGQYEQIVALLQTLRDRRQRVWIDSCRMDLLDPRDRRLRCQFGLTIYVLLGPGEFSK